MLLTSLATRFACWLACSSSSRLARFASLAHLVPVQGHLRLHEGSLVRGDVLELVELVEEQVVRSLGPVALHCSAPQVTGDVCELSGQGDYLCVVVMGWEFGLVLG